MKTAVDKNESSFEKMKRESLEWLERHGRTAPPFIALLVNLAQESQAKELSDEDIFLWADESATEMYSVHSTHRLITRDFLIQGAKAMRDGLITNK